jgi:predicted methyltransferase
VSTLRRSAPAAALALLSLLTTACAESRPVAAPPPSTAHAAGSTITHETPAPSPALRAILAEPDRGPKDRALDAGRRPAELFAFGGVHAGSRVVELGAWEGYGAELLARAVAPDGKVWAVDPPDFDKYTHATWEERAKRSAFARIERVARSYDDPLPPGTPPADVAFVTLFYHDMVWLGVDRAKMNAALYRALAPGGALVIVDHSAKTGQGITVAKTLHRIEQSVVVDEVTRAGFVLEAESDFLRHPEDPRDWSASDEAPMEKRGTSDRFALRFRKPRS